jgi:hypothetical protein
MNETEKLRVLLPHWIEHNEEHASEFQHWAITVDDAAPELLAAVEAMHKVNHSLALALDKLGGPLPLSHHHEHHHSHSH